MDTVKLKRLKLVIETYLSEELAEELVSTPEVNLDLYVGWMRDTIVAEVRYTIAGNILDTVNAKYPADWWEAFKNRWFPEWAKNRWPINWTYVQLTARELYPKLSLPDRSDATISLSRNVW